MKRLLRIFDLSKSERRVVLIIIFILITIAFVGYERRVRHRPIRPTPVIDTKPSPTTAEIEHDP